MRQPSCLHGCRSILWLSIILMITLFPNTAPAFDTITSNQPLKYNQTIVSDVFELGFFSPGNSEKWYVGIWYRNIKVRTVVWVANRDSPLANSYGSLTIAKNGNLVLVDEASNPIWFSSNQTRSGGGNTVAQLLDTGNLVVRLENDVDSRNYLWQSFDHPTDTLLPRMKMGWDAKSGLNRNLTSWRTHDDPSSGDYCFKMNIDGFPEIFLLDKQKPIYRSGPWNGLRFSGVPEMNAGYNMSFNFVMDKDEVSYSFGLEEKILYSRLVVSSSGLLERYIWIESSQIWSRFWFARKDQCDTYLECGVFGVCDNNASPVCQCLIGFKPKNPQAWNLRDGSDGCIRTSKLNCPDDGFLPLKDMKLPESSGAFVDKTMSLLDCEKACRSNCSCTAYANMNISGGGSGCVIWAGDLLDLRRYALSEGGQALFVRVSAADLEATETMGSKKSSNKTGHTEMVIGISVGGGILLLGLSICFVWKRTQMARKQKIQHIGPRERSEDLLMNEGVIVSRRDYSGERADELDLPLFDFNALVIATGNFSDENKLGQGGFGIVYKGTLVGGQQIAVKRLSKNSGQGIEEFKNEVRLLVRLQHRNLVRLLGCCIEVEEKMLIYEYMENKSLDSILFNKDRCSILNWQMRFNIICGIARGLLYLHQDSRFRIIHRDLKASNILLDKEMNPKISDFGMARIFGRDQMEASTRRVVGTYGYMSPEYAMDGLFSVKSDVFSFGVLVMEIVTGKKNRGFYNADQQLNLLGYAWRLWREGKGLELIDPSVDNSYSPGEVIRCLQVGLLCVQERAEDRPTMSSVVLMLSSETATSMSQPKHPGFCLGRHHAETESSSTKLDESCTLNQVTVTILDGR